MIEIQRHNLIGYCSKIGGRGASLYIDIDDARFLIPATVLRSLEKSPVGKMVGFTALFIGGAALITKITQTENEQK